MTAVPPASVLGEAYEAAACFQPDQAPLALLNFREMGFFPQSLGFPVVSNFAVLDTLSAVDDRRNR